MFFDPVPNAEQLFPNPGVLLSTFSDPEETYRDEGRKTIRTMLHDGQ